LLADVDSSVGGKTAVNHPLGKNSIGAFKQPEHVCIDLEFLKTLPSRELTAGYFELIKHGLIHDRELLEFLKGRSLEPLDLEFLEEAIYRSCAVKAQIVEADETESGLRATLNFGHTLGHLVETHAGYGTYLHGEAVGLGMLFAAFASHQWSHLSTESWTQVQDFLLPLMPRFTLPPLSQQQFQQLMLHDKKSGSGGVNFILLSGVGRCQIRKNTPIDELWRLYQRFLQAFPQICQHTDS
jgi:3-dehydroquinate synthase